MTHIRKPSSRLYCDIFLTNHANVILIIELGEINPLCFN